MWIGLYVCSALLFPSFLQVEKWGFVKRTGGHFLIFETMKYVHSSQHLIHREVKRDGESSNHFFCSPFLFFFLVFSLLSVHFLHFFCWKSEKKKRASLGNRHPFHFLWTYTWVWWWVPLSKKKGYIYDARRPGLLPRFNKPSVCVLVRVSCYTALFTDEWVFQCQRA